MRDIWHHPAWKDTRLLVLYSNDDQYVPPSVDKELLVQTWERVHGATEQTNPGLFKLLPLANHEITNEWYHAPCSGADLMERQGASRNDLVGYDLSELILVANLTWL